MLFLFSLVVTYVVYAGQHRAGLDTTIFTILIQTAVCRTTTNRVADGNTRHEPLFIVGAANTWLVLVINTRALKYSAAVMVIPLTTINSLDYLFHIPPDEQNMTITAANTFRQCLPSSIYNKVVLCCFVTDNWDLSLHNVANKHYQLQIFQ